MTPEERLRRAIESRTSRVEPTADALSHIEEKLMATQQSDNRNRLLIGIGAAAAVAALVVGAVALSQDDEEPVTTDTTTTEAPTTTTEATTTTSEPAFATVDPDQPVFPDPTTSQRFDDPVAAARAFAIDLAGFPDDLVVGPFLEGDARSGEVEVRAFADAAPTTVLVRQLEDDAWWVLGATSDAIRLAAPAARDVISSPQPLAGQAYAFEGTVLVRLYVDGVQEPVAETFVTGRGDGVLGDFEGELAFTAPDGATHGVLVLLSQSGEDGSTVDAQVLRVLL